MTNNTNGISTDITIDNKKLETVCSFKYLGAIALEEGSKPEVLSRIAQTTAAVTKLKVIWNDKNIAISSKVRLMRSLAMSIFLYACETWTITVDIERRIQALEMRCFRKLLGISYRDHITNEEVKARIGNAIGPYEDLLTLVKMRKLKWYGHVTRSSGLAKTILQGTVQGGRRRGRQRKRWEDNIKEWTGLEWNIILRKAENREEWRKLVVTSTVQKVESGMGCPDWHTAMHSLRLQKLLWIYCPGHAGVSGNERADRLASTADITSGLQLGRAGVLRGLRNFLSTDKPEHHSIDRLKERGVEKGSGRHSTLQGRERSVFNQTNIGTVSRATWGRLLRDGAERVWAFPSATMPS